MQRKSKVAVAGATGRAGRHVVELLEARGYEVVPMSRTSGVDVVTGDGLAEALTGADCVVDATTGPSPEEAAATEFFTTAARNLHEAGAAAGVRRLVIVSIIGCDRFTGGYMAAKLAHERAALAGPIPARILRAAQFHEFVAQLLDWGRQNGASYVPKMRTQLVAARTVGEVLADWRPRPTSSSASGRGRRWRRSRVPASRPSLRWLGSSPRGAETRRASRRGATPGIRTAGSSRTVGSSRVRMPFSEARRSRSGSVLPRDTSTPTVAGTAARAFQTRRAAVVNTVGGDQLQAVLPAIGVRQGEPVLRGSLRCVGGRDP
jgi:NAD(P)H-binding